MLQLQAFLLYATSGLYFWTCTHGKVGAVRSISVRTKLKSSSEIVILLVIEQQSIESINNSGHPEIENQPQHKRRLSLGTVLEMPICLLIKKALHSRFDNQASFLAPRIKSIS
jgi:hypothetical protein